MRPDAPSPTQALLGLVIHYAFLWSHEHDAGRDNAPYSRPCLIVLDEPARDRRFRQVLALPFTTQPPRSNAPTLLPPPRVKAALGLDADASWIVLDEANEFVWRGPDVQPTPDGRAHYGHVPPALLSQVREGMIEALVSGRLRRIWRTV